MPYSVLIVEDDGFVGVELETTLSENGYDPLPLVKTYGDALQAVNSASFSYCVLDLRLSRLAEQDSRVEPEGRRILALLGARGIPTVVYSGVVDEQTALSDLHAGVVEIDKLEPYDRVVAELDRLSGRAGAQA